MYFTMEKKIRSEIFSIDKKRNILFYYFQIYLKPNEYLFNIVLIIVGINLAHHEGNVIIALILLNKKNNFVELRKMDILDVFCEKNLEYLMMLSMILLLLIIINQILLVYGHIYIYQLYIDMALFCVSNKYNRYKKMKKIYINIKNILKNIKTSRFGVTTTCKTSEYILIISGQIEVCLYIVQNFLHGLYIFV